VFSFQVSLHIVECHVDEPKNILSNNPSWSGFFDDSKHLRPEVTVIVSSFSLSCNTEWLTGEASANKVMRAMCYHGDEILAIDYLGVEWQATPMKETNDA